jgi:hypothetical protein
MPPDTSNTYRPRLAAEIRPDQLIRLQQMLPHGMQKHLFIALVDGIIALYDKGGMPALGAIISEHINIVQIAEAGKANAKSVLGVK